MRFLANRGLDIGVNWYLVPDENHNGDGKHVGYLSRDFMDGPWHRHWVELTWQVTTGGAYRLFI